MSGDAAPAERADGPAGAVLTAPAPFGPPPPPLSLSQPLFGKNWPGPSAPPARKVLATVTAAGVVGAVAIPDGPRGVGWFVAVLAIMAATVLVARRAGRLRPAPAELGWAVAALALAAVGAVRDAGWLTVLCLLTAVAAGSLAVAGPSFRTVLGGAIALPLGALRGVGWVGRGLRTGSGPLRQHLRLAASLVVGLLVLAVFAPLLAGADAAFARVLGDLMPRLDATSLIRWVFLFGLTALGAIGASFLVVAPPQRAADRERRASKLRKLEWALPIGLLTALFLLFVGVQFTTLFGSDDYVLRTTGLTYAEYARSGFWQLLAVTVLALGVIVVGLRFAPERSPSERALKRSLLAQLAVSTLIIVASALSRMWLYQQAYGFTVLRLLVITCELWLGFGFLLVLVSVLRLRRAGLSRGLAAGATAALLGLAVLNPEGYVAAHNVSRFASTGQLDDGYLATLSADAVPALSELPEPMRSCVLTHIAEHTALLFERSSDWRSWNLARGVAGSTLTAASLSEGCRAG